MLVDCSSEFLLVLIEFYTLSKSPVISKAGAAGALRQERALAVIGIEFCFEGFIDEHIELEFTRI